MAMKKKIVVHLKDDIKDEVKAAKEDRSLMKAVKKTKSVSKKKSSDKKHEAKESKQNLLRARSAKW